MIAITIAFIYEYGPRLVWFKLVANVQKYFERIQHVYIPIIKMSAINKRQSLVVSSVFTTFFENLDLQYYGIGVILNICKETKMIYIVSLYFVYEISQSDHECECVCVLVVCVCVLGVGWGWYAVYFSICIMFSLCRLLADKKRQWSLTHILGITFFKHGLCLSSMNAWEPMPPSMICTKNTRFKYTTISRS